MYSYRNFPLWKKNENPPLQNDINRERIVELIEVIKKKELLLVENKCLCNNEHEDADVVIAEKDRYGVFVPQVLCSKCGLIRSSLVFDDRSNNLFYEKYYRGIYVLPDYRGDKDYFEALFQSQIYKGKRVLDLLNKYVNELDIINVVEIGCGAGGILFPFKESGKSVSGYDFDEKYLEYGRSKGLDLYYGDFYEQTVNNKYDLIILNHVFEHFLHPLNEIKRLLPKIRMGKYLYVQVPGIYCIDDVYKNPFTYFQSAHIYNFYEQYFRVLFEKFGLKVIYGDERCTFICQKVSEEIPDVKYVYDESLSVYHKKNAEYLLECKNRYEKNLKRDRKNRIKGKLYNIGSKLGLSKIRNFVKRK